MAHLPKKGQKDWADDMEDFLKQSLAHDGTLVGGKNNPHTGGPNPNLANQEKAGLMRVAGDLDNTAHEPKVAGIQGNPVASTAPTHGQVLTWDAKSGTWVPTDPPGFNHAMLINSVLG